MYSQELQNKLRFRLNRFMNGQVGDRKEMIQALFWQDAWRREQAKVICSLYKQLKDNITPDKLSNIEVNSSIYTGKNIHVRNMMEYLAVYLKENLIGAYIHGSLGSNEEILYSDFDALVIIKNRVFLSEDRLIHVGKYLSHAQLFMLKQDPLQHHGWYVLTEMDLGHYPEHYFPHELFQYAKSLLSDQGLKTTITLPVMSNNDEPFINMAHDISRRLNNKQYPKNMYTLKCLLSQFMLLPALYIQARYKKGIFKKYSFEDAKKHINSDGWTIMDEVSSIRRQWHYEISPLQQRIMSTPGFLSRKISKNIAPRIPDDIKRILSETFYSRIKLFTDVMLSNLTK